MTQPQPAISYPNDGHDACYDVEEQSFWFKHRNDCIVTLLKRFPPGGPLLDIGGGNGFVTRGLIDAGFDAWLLEPLVAGAANARRRGVGRIFETTLDRWQAPEESPLAAAGLFDVLEHIEAPVPFLRQIHTRLPPGGRLYVTVPAFTWLWSSDDRQAGHFRRYRLETIARELAEGGFVIEYQSYFFRFLLPMLFLLRSLPDRLGIARKSAADSAQRDHRAEGIAGRLVQSACASELRKLARGGHLGWGTSCLVVARRH